MTDKKSIAISKAKIESFQRATAQEIVHLKSAGKLSEELQKLLRVDSIANENLAYISKLDFEKLLDASQNCELNQLLILARFAGVRFFEAENILQSGLDLKTSSLQITGLFARQIYLPRNLMMKLLANTKESHEKIFPLIKTESQMCDLLAKLTRIARLPVASATLENLLSSFEFDCIRQELPAGFSAQTTGHLALIMQRFETLQKSDAKI